MDNFYYNKLMEQALDIINRYIKSGNRVAVAVSGGMDSVCLLHLFSVSGLKKESVVVANVEHGIRGESSVRDSNFVRALADKYGFEFVGESVDIPALKRESGRSEETEARIARKRFFSSLLSSGKVDFIATAHHDDDRVESVLMHLFRGCGTSGLVGMSERDGQYIRPLINATRSQIEGYVTAKNLRFVVDESNFEDKYTRNYLRNTVIPLIRERYDLSQAIRTLSDNAKEDEQFIRSMMDEEKFIKVSDGEVSLALDVFGFHKALTSRYIMRAVAFLGRVTDFESKHIFAVEKLADGENGKRIDLGQSLSAVKEYGKIVFFIGEKQEEKLTDECEFTIGMSYFGDGIIEVYPTDAKVQPGKLIIDVDKVPDGSVIRTRREGDVFKPFGSGTKKLKEYLIDSKIPQRKRDKLPLLCYNDRVLAIFGVQISEEIKLTDGTQNAVSLKYTED
ncbi:MAG: tRNA lysidine(34) synthetase TilS [Clostridia bacterium]|nr:tRNA lysidine(34) synthetase TilS [Clostridia bacterium]